MHAKRPMLVHPTPPHDRHHLQVSITANVSSLVPGRAPLFALCRYSVHVTAAKAWPPGHARAPCPTTYQNSTAHVTVDNQVLAPDDPTPLKKAISTSPRA